MSIPDPIRIGLIGAGRIGKLHAANLATRIPSARLVGIADPRRSEAQALGRQFKADFAGADYQELLRRPEVEAVVVCSPTNTHATVIRAAAARGKHIFCEKPIDLDPGRIRQILEEVDESGVKLQVGFNRRFDPSFAKVKELVASGKIGAAHLIRITSRDPALPPLDYLRSSGGIFLDMTIHDFDMVRYLSGSEAVEVYAMGAALIDPQVRQFGDADTATVQIRLANDALATIDNSRAAAYGYDQRIEVFGSTGMAAVSNRRPDLHLRLDKEGTHQANPEHFFLERYQEAYVLELQAFVRSIQTDSTPPVGGADGLAAVLVGLAAGRSMKENRPVKINEIE